MEFHEKLQQLRKHRGLTQEELAEILFVSRTAVSKWESGRGLPSIDSLKAISAFFGVTIDDLLSGSELLTIAEEDGRQKEMHTRSLIFGLLDLSAAMLVFLPFFGLKAGDAVRAVSLPGLAGIPAWLKAIFMGVVLAMTIMGALLLALQGDKPTAWARCRERISCGVNAVGMLLFIVSRQPYAAVFLFIFLAIKALMLIRWR